jgi:hypothetical protein
VVTPAATAGSAGDPVKPISALAVKSAETTFNLLNAISFDSLVDRFVERRRPMLDRLQAGRILSSMQIRCPRTLIESAESSMSRADRPCREELSLTARW